MNVKMNEDTDKLEEIDLSELLGGEVISTMGADNWDQDSFTFFGPETRSLFLRDELTTENSTNLISQLLELDRSSNDPIYLWLFTPGGSASGAMAIYDTINMISAPVTTIAVGQCMSAGLLLLQAGKTRLAFPSCMFMYHMPIVEGSFFSREVVEQFPQTYKFYQDRFDKIMRERFTGTTRTWNKKFRNSTGYNFGSEEAEELGIIDDIVTNINDVYALLEGTPSELED